MATLSKEIFFFQRQGRLYHNPNGKCARRNEAEKKRLRVKHSPKPKEFGYIVSDSVERITDGVKDYFLSAVDAKMKFGLTINYPRLTSANMRDFYLKFKSVYPERLIIGNLTMEVKTKVNLTKNLLEMESHTFLFIRDVPKLILISKDTTEAYRKNSSIQI